MTDGNLSSTPYSLTKGQTVANCVPFVTTRQTSAPDASEYRRGRNKVVSPYFDGSDNLVIQRDLDVGNLVVEATIVEFDPARTQVISDTFQIAPQGNNNDDATAFTFPGAASVTPANAFVYFGQYQNASTSNYHSTYLVKADITSSTQVTMHRGASRGTCDGTYFVVESTAGDFSVSTVDILLSGVSSNTGSVSVTSGKTWLLGSAEVDASNVIDNIESFAYRASLNTAGDTVTVERQSTSYDLNFHGQLIQFSDNTTVDRGAILSQGDLDSQDVSVSVDLNTAMAVAPGHMGHYLSCASNGGSLLYSTASSMAAMSFPDASTLRVQRNSDSTVTSTDIGWEIVNWDTGGGTTTTRRFMVTS